MDIQTNSKIDFSSHRVTVAWRQSLMKRHEMTFFPVFPRQKKRHTNLWLFSQFSDGKKNDIQTYDFFPSFRTAKKTTYKPMTFFPVFGRQKKRHTNLWLFSQFSDGKKNDIQTYDFFPSFRTAKKTTYKPMTFFFGRHKKRHTNLTLNPKP